MKRYVTIVGIEENDLKKNYMDFKNRFSIDLDDSKYKNGCNIKTAWEKVITDIYGKKRYGNVDYYMNNIFSSIKNNKKEIAHDLINNYGMYRDDIWINTFFNIKYIQDRGIKYENWEEIYLRNYWMDISDNPDLIDKLPILEGIDDQFCLKYKINVLDTRIKLLDVVTNKREVIDSYKKWDSISEKRQNEILKNKVGFDFRNRKDVKRWDYKELLNKERNLEFELEDRILFYKTFNTPLTRAIVGCFDQNDKGKLKYDIHKLLIEDDNITRNYIFKLCGIESIKWKILIGKLKFSYWYKSEAILDELENSLDGYGKINLTVKNILDNYKEINAINDDLVKGLLYIYYKFYNDEKQLQIIIEQAQKYVDMFGKKNNELNRTMKEFYLIHRDSKRLRVKYEEENIGILYIYLQRFIILSSRYYANEKMKNLSNLEKRNSKNN